MRETPPRPAEPSTTDSDAQRQGSITPAERERIKREVEHLFRYSLNEGHINPLMHVIIDYRSGDLR